MPSEEEILPFWLNVVGGVYKGRAYGFPPSATIIASSVDYKVLGHPSPCKMRTLRRCGERFNNFRGTMQMNERKESTKRRSKPHLGMTSSPSRLK
ncbi:hypothetical protein A4A49_35653 [Nicotiana attenuata]|uniref:Uncharacterized protein n=1 Tax=Nicotiana attenuata TaxID=49451 RepID=A0A1J6IV31_NICAT|nr:hypothetical protein A4A49_35653 [Nicotiana attenuata]